MFPMLYLARVESTVVKLCREIEITKRNNNWLGMSENDLLFELANAILGSQVRYELATTAAARLRDEGFLDSAMYNCNYTALAKKIEIALSRPLFNSSFGITGSKYRFPKIRACQISQTIRNIYGNNNSLRDLLINSPSANQARANLVRLVMGYGPKQASLFLRNIGYSNDLAILDSHILRYMNIRGMTSLNASPSNISIYENTENRLLEYSMELGFPLGCLDQAIWITMRVAKQEAMI